jgi:predicted nucleic acid-binding protein
MIVVADTSPINYLVLIEQIDLLRQLYGKVIIPEAVYVESIHQRSPITVRRWASSTQVWVEIHKVSETLPLNATLGRGEVEALPLASTLHADLVLLDDSPARQAAKELGLAFTGVLGILGEAAAAGLVNIDDALIALSTTSFFASADLIERVRQRAKSTPPA